MTIGNETSDDIRSCKCVGVSSVFNWYKLHVKNKIPHDTATVLLDAKDPRAQGITKRIKYTQPGGDLFDETFKGVCKRLINRQAGSSQ